MKWAQFPNLAFGIWEREQGWVGRLARAQAWLEAFRTLTYQGEAMGSWSHFGTWEVVVVAGDLSLWGRNPKLRWSRLAGRPALHPTQLQGRLPGARASLPYRLLGSVKSRAQNQGGCMSQIEAMGTSPWMRPNDWIQAHCTPRAHQLTHPCPPPFQSRLPACLEMPPHTFPHSQAITASSLPGLHCESRSANH